MSYAVLLIEMCEVMRPALTRLVDMDGDVIGARGDGRGARSRPGGLRAGKAERLSTAG